MEDIFHWCREGNGFQVRLWLDDTAHDLNQGDDHGFSPLHWAAKEGRLAIVETLINKGARIHATNMGDDTALHLSAAHGHRDIVQMLLRNKADINAVNEHGNVALHYACFWGHQQIAEDLINAGAIVNISNKYGETPLEKSKGQMAATLHELAEKHGQDTTRKMPFRDQSWLGTKTRSRDATLSRHSGISLNDLHLQMKIASTPSGETWRGKWQGNEICAKFLSLGDDPTPDVIRRASRQFSDEFPKLRIFSHPNVSPVIGCTNAPPNLVVITQYMKHGSLYQALHETSNFMIDHGQAIKFAIDIARGMAFLHTLDPLIPRMYLNSRHVTIDDDLTARINMADAKFSFQERNKMYHPAWLSPEALQKKSTEINVKAADMWSFAIVLWELTTRQVPFGDTNPMELGMKIALEDLRITIPPGIAPHMARLVKICMHEEPGKRPTFEQIIPILEKMQLN
ncbi:Integrin-linked protein kinase -like protein pat-4 [Halotydeus destructor]|nr:Integrin-linked protein kinase -like protein pat-4 [Halotydeus destructor]